VTAAVAQLVVGQNAGADHLVVQGFENVKRDATGIPNSSAMLYEWAAQFVGEMRVLTSSCGSGMRPKMLLGTARPTR
jgi:hypothetical protein